MPEDNFPYKWTDFIDKVNARYDGDPQGDYVMAEHINAVQDAITRIEKALGVRRDTDLSVEDRLDRLSQLQPVAVPEVGYFSHFDGEDRTYEQELADRYSLLLLDTPAEVDHENLYGRISVQGVGLEVIQNEIAKWKAAGASGIYLDGLERETRQEEAQLIESVTQEGLEVMVSGDILHLLTDTVSPYNPDGRPLPFPSQTTFVLKHFGYESERVPFDVVMSNLLPLVRLVKDKGYRLLGMTDARDKTIYNEVHTLALLLSLDYMYWGVLEGSTVARLPYTYNWPVMMSDWRTDSPNLFYTSNGLERQVLNGSIQLTEDGPSFPGLQVSSEGIEWLKETIDGTTIKKGSIPPDRLSTYDIEKIVYLINHAPEDIRIKPTKIDSNDQDLLLPTNIPASHMVQNVIEAINKKNNINTVEFRRIEDAAIKDLDSEKLKGHIPTPQLIRNTLEAINQSSTKETDDKAYYIDVPFADITNLKGRGTADYAEFIGDAATFTNANIRETLSTHTIHNEDLITSPLAKISEIHAGKLHVSSIEGLDSLSVPHIEAGNMDTLVMNAIEAHIATGDFDTVITQTLESEVVITELIEATTSFSKLSIDDKANISDLISNVIDADFAFLGELQAGVINTDNVQLVSDSGAMNLTGDTLKVYSFPDENNIRTLRVLIGHLEDVTGDPEDYGFVALSPDGETRILDHTGVYEGGIHKDAVTEETLKEGAVSGRAIQHDAISVDHLKGKIITGDWLDGETITGDHIAGKTITASEIASLAIDTHHLNGRIIEGTNIKGQVIEGEHLKANAISTQHLRVGFGVNLMQGGMDSFEQLPTGNVNLNELNTDVRTQVVDRYAYEGRHALEAMSYEFDSTLYIGRRIPIEDRSYGLSYFIRVPVGTPETTVIPGVYLTDGTEGKLVLGDEQRAYGLYERHRFILDDTQDYPYLIPVIRFTESNSTVFIDAVQVEEMDPDGEHSPWRTASTTLLSGDNIQTGRIDAKHLRIGGGTIFGQADIIHITDEGITARSGDGSASLNSRGLEVDGGAFSLTTGTNKDEVFVIDENGLRNETLFARIKLSPEDGFEIYNKEADRPVLHIDPQTGELKLAGTAKFYDTETYQEQTLDEAINTTVESEMNSLREAQERQIDVRLAMKIGYRNFNTPHDEAVYITGVEIDPVTYREVMVDAPGSIYVRDVQENYEILNQALFLYDAPEGETLYITWDNTHEQLFVIYYETTYTDDRVTGTRWRDLSGNTVTMTDSVYILGDLEVQR